MEGTTFCRRSDFGKRAFLSGVNLQPYFISPVENHAWPVVSCRPVWLCLWLKASLCGELKQLGCLHCPIQFKWKATKLSGHLLQERRNEERHCDTAATI